QPIADAGGRGPAGRRCPAVRGWLPGIVRGLVWELATAVCRRSRVCAAWLRAGGGDADGWPDAGSPARVVCATGRFRGARWPPVKRDAVKRDAATVTGRDAYGRPCDRLYDRRGGPYRRDVLRRGDGRRVRRRVRVRCARAVRDDPARGRLRDGSAARRRR